MSKQNKTFKLDAATIGSVQDVAKALNVSQAEVIRLAMEKAFSAMNVERMTLMKVYDATSEGIQFLEAERDNADKGMTDDQYALYQFLNDTWDRARTMPQFPDWA